MMCKQINCYVLAWSKCHSTHIDLQYSLSLHFSQLLSNRHTIAFRRDCTPQLICMMKIKRELLNEIVKIIYLFFIYPAVHVQWAHITFPSFDNAAHGICAFDPID